MKHTTEAFGGFTPRNFKKTVAILSEGHCPTCLGPLAPEPPEPAGIMTLRVNAACTPCGLSWRLLAMDDAGAFLALHVGDGNGVLSIMPFPDHPASAV